jgi:PPP family 3-phenylpropionic acid transporter
MITDTLESHPNAGEPTTVRVLYFGYYMALGSLSPFIALYFKRAGLSGVQIGLLASLIQVVTSLTAIPWSAAADRFRAHRQILCLALGAAPVCIFFLSRTAEYLLIVPLVMLYAFFVSPIVPLLDSSALAVVKEGSLPYGQLRVGGSLGWIISVWLVGILIQAFGIHWLFYAYIAFMSLTFIYSLSRPPRAGTIQIPVWSNLRVLLAEPRVIYFLLSIFLVAVGSGAVMNFFSLYLDGIGAAEGTIGLAWALAAISEIPVMIYSGVIMHRLGATGLLKLAFFIYAVRWLLFSFIRDPGWALAVQLLHGLSFAAFLTAGVTYLNERTPSGLTTTAQAVFNVVAFGLAAIVGSLLGGYLYDAVGMPAMLRVLSVLTLCGLFLFWLTAQPRRPAYAVGV